MSSPEEHSLLKSTYQLDHFEFLTDYEDEFGERFGFIDIEGNQIKRYERGYVGVNPDTTNIVIEVDYLLGENIKTVLKVMEEL